MLDLLLRPFRIWQLKRRLRADEPGAPPGYLLDREDQRSCQAPVDQAPTTIRQPS